MVRGGGAIEPARATPGNRLLTSGATFGGSTRAQVPDSRPPRRCPPAGPWPDDGRTATSGSVTIVLWNTAMSLDGCIAGPEDAMDWVFRFADPGRHADEILRSTGAILAGRRSFDVGRKPGELPEARKPFGGASHRLRDRRRSWRPRALSIDDHRPPSRPGFGRSARPRLRRTVGDRIGLRRTEDPPARAPDRAGFEAGRTRQPGDLGTPVLSLRHSHLDVGSRRPRR